MTAVEEIMALVQNYAVERVEFFITPSGLGVRIKGTDREAAGIGLLAEDAAQVALTTWRLKAQHDCAAEADRS